MFKNSEINQIDQKYFTIIQSTGYHIIIKSKNTKHTWDIYCRDGDGFRSLVISHKHKDEQPFHEQGMMHPRTVLEAQKCIMEHDEWHMKNRK